MGLDINKLFMMIGQMYVETNALRNMVTELQAKVKKYEDEANAAVTKEEAVDG